MATHSSTLAWRIPTDRGAWQATVDGVARSRMQLKRLGTQTNFGACNKEQAIIITLKMLIIHYSRS